MDPSQRMAQEAARRAREAQQRQQEEMRRQQEASRRVQETQQREAERQRRQRERDDQQRRQWAWDDQQRQQREREARRRRDWEAEVARQQAAAQMRQQREQWLHRQAQQVRWPWQRTVGQPMQMPPHTYTSPAPIPSTCAMRLAGFAIIVVILAGLGYIAVVMLSARVPSTVHTATSAALQQSAGPAVTPTETLAGTVKHVKSNGLNLRAGPGPDKAIVRPLRRGEPVVLLGDASAIGDSIWVHIRARDDFGWVNQTFLE